MPKKIAPLARHSAVLGKFRVVVRVPGSHPKDVTFLRNQPTSVDSYSTADPFGWATAVVTFPQITIVDDIGSGELAFLQDYADVDIYLVDQNGNDIATVFEGFIASMDWNQDDSGSTLQVQCKGAVFQVDNYIEKPFYPPQPWAYERLIERVFSHYQRPDLRLAPITTQWPAGWSKKAIAPLPSTPTYMRPYGVTPGQNVTGYYGRATGSWDKSLTSYVQGLLSVMLDDLGQQWTIGCKPGRQPYLYVRQMFDRTPDYTCLAGTPGVSIQVTRDLTQFANSVYGSGTDAAGTEWSRMQVSANGQDTTYEPLAWDAEVYPHTKSNDRLNLHKMVVETNVKFDNGFDEHQAILAARVMLRRDMDPGLTGTITLKVDLSSKSRFLIQAGQTILVRYLAGSGPGGTLLHIAQVDVNVNDGIATLKVDTKFRDLLTIEEALERTIDPLTPVKLLQVGKRSLTIQDQLAPWDYSRGAGYIPEKSLNFYNHKPQSSLFPYIASHPAQLDLTDASHWTTKHPPKKYPQYYVEVNAHAKDKNKRWMTGVPIRLSEKGDIRLTEIAAYDKEGNLARCMFHFSLYYVHVSYEDMPLGNDGKYSPFIPNAFQSTTRYGLEIPADTPGWSKQAQQSLIMGWGTGTQPGGYSPGMKSRGGEPTGLLIDEMTWSYDFTNSAAARNYWAGTTKPPPIAFTAYGVFYAEYHEPVWFMGRLFRKEPGT